MTWFGIMKGKIMFSLLGFGQMPDIHGFGKGIAKSKGRIFLRPPPN
jgi:hypothetical protein